MISLYTKTESGVWCVRKYRGRWYDTGDPDIGRVELFTMAVFSAAMDRGAPCVRRWESEGLIPKTLFISPPTSARAGVRRLYPAVTVVAANNLYRGMNVHGYKNASNLCGFDVRIFLARLSQIFYLLDVTVDPKTMIATSGGIRVVYEK